MSGRDLRRNGRRFSLVGGVVALVATLATVLTGLAHGLVSDGISGLRAMPITHMAFEPGADATFSRSTLGAPQLQALRDVPGTTTTPIGVTFVNATGNRGTSVDLAVVGIESDGFFPAARAGSGDPLAGVVLDERARDEGIRVGDELRLGATGGSLPVTGFADNGSYGHAPIAFVALDRWRELVYGDTARGRYSAIAIRTTDPAAVEGAARAADLELLTKEQAYDGSPGYTAETMTMTMIRGFLLVISALIVGAFFTILTIQRTRQIAVMKALGASTGFLVRDALGQVLVLVGLSTVVGAAVGAALVAMLASTPAPVELPVGGVIQSAAILILVSVAGSLVALRRTVAIEPATALATEDL